MTETSILDNYENKKKTNPFVNLSFFANGSSLVFKASNLFQIQ